MNERKVLAFTEEFYELLAGQKLEVSEILEIMSAEKVSIISETAGEVLEKLNRGELFSAALGKCEKIRFDEIYLLFVRFAERTGNLEEAFKFLYERVLRREKNCQKLLEALIYPLFVILLALGVSFFLLFRGESIFGGSSLFGREQKVKVLESAVFLLVVSVLLIYFVYKKIGENKLYEAFLGIGFLVRGGVSVTLAVSYGMLVAGPDSRFGRFFGNAKQKLEYGMGIENAFGFSEGILGRERICRRIERMFYLAGRRGRNSEVFERVAESLKQEDEKKLKLWTILMEPLFISLTAIFLLSLTVNLFLPFFTNNMWI